MRRYDNNVIPLLNARITVRDNNLTFSYNTRDKTIILYIQFPKRLIIKLFIKISNSFYSKKSKNIL